MNTDNASCALNKKCKEQYSKEVAENMSNDEEKLEALYKQEELK